MSLYQVITIGLLVHFVLCNGLNQAEVRLFQKGAHSLQIFHGASKTLYTISKEKNPSWKIDDDSSELFCESSEDAKSNTIQSVTSKNIITPKLDTKAPSSTLMSKSGGSAFDFGLLFAFPIIVGTLALFFLFPILGPMFADSLPPPMSY